MGEQQVSMESAARAAARMAAVAAMHEVLRGQTELLIMEARDAGANGLAVKAGAILRGSAGLGRMIEDGTELAAQQVAKAALAELDLKAEGSRLTVADLPPEMQA